MKRQTRALQDMASKTADGPLEPVAPLVAGQDRCRDLDWALRQEWWLTNGLGGYAASTILGVNTRRTHGLLVAATQPPGGRAVLLAKLEETLVVPGARYDLSTNRYAGVLHPEGYRYQESFRLDPWPTFVYRIGDLLLEKSIVLLPQENTTVVSFWLREAADPLELILRPLVACRDFRWVSQENPTFRTRIEQGPGTLVIHPYEGLPPLILHHTAELFEPTAYWYKQFEYTAEASTDQASREDLYSPGQFVCLLRPGETAQLIATTSRIPCSHWGSLTARALEHQEAPRRRARALKAGPLTTRLVQAAESFLVKAADGARLVVAGHPGLPVSGRDLLIALPGLTLATGQPEAARDLLQTMAGHCRDGLLPVRFTEEDGTPEYDSVDTALWFFWAVHRYAHATGDWRFVGRRLLDVLMDIVDYYVQGTQFHIVMDQDGLITTARETLPLTWMDARVEGHPVTRRAGKAIEVNALWYHALMTMAELGERFRLRLARQYARLARLVRANAARAFWDASRGSCHDVIGPQALDSAVRPNQLLAVALPSPLFGRAQARQILDVVEQQLLTPVGLRTLSPGHSAYLGRWAGPAAQREQARHRGCAWPWWLGPYWTASLAARGGDGRRILRQQLEGFRDRLDDGGWGTVAELYDGDPPHLPGGAVASAVSVAELLRLIHEQGLTDL